MQHRFGSARELGSLRWLIKPCTLLAKLEPRTVEPSALTVLQAGLQPAPSQSPSELRRARLEKACEAFRQPSLFEQSLCNNWMCEMDDYFRLAFPIVIPRAACFVFAKSATCHEAAAQDTQEYGRVGKVGSLRSETFALCSLGWLGLLSPSRHRMTSSQEFKPMAVLIPCRTAKLARPQHRCQVTTRPARECHAALWISYGR